MVHSTRGDQSWKANCSQRRTHTLVELRRGVHTGHVMLCWLAPFIAALSSLVPNLGQKCTQVMLCCVGLHPKEHHVRGPALQGAANASQLHEGLPRANRNTCTQQSSGKSIRINMELNRGYLGSQDKNRTCKDAAAQCCAHEIAMAKMACGVSSTPPDTTRDHLTFCPLQLHRSPALHHKQDGGTRGGGEGSGVPSWHMHGLDSELGHGRDVQASVRVNRGPADNWGRASPVKAYHQGASTTPSVTAYW
jgi:hypothetical protein